MPKQRAAAMVKNGDPRLRLCAGGCVSGATANKTTNVTFPLVSRA
jgi:hypothetical protein